MNEAKPFLCTVFIEGMEPGGFPMHWPEEQCPKCELAMRSVAANRPGLGPRDFLGVMRPASDYVRECEEVRARGNQETPHP
jgi:hypothetical protein